MGSIAVNLYIEDVTTTGKVMVWSLNPLPYGGLCNDSIQARG